MADALGLPFRSPGPYGSRLRALALKAWRKGLISTGRAASLFDLDLESFQDQMTDNGEAQGLDPDDVVLGAAREE